MILHSFDLQRIYIDSIPGSPRVEGDEEEDDIDDLENEFDIANKDPNSLSEAMLYPHLAVGRGSHANGYGNTGSDLDSSVPTDIPLLTYGQEVNLFFFTVIPSTIFVLFKFY